mmetsp:Transcript_36886/g.113662  ORF Transcript_36886/g.113662 Transcript_36886/m.113662 type:complete len:342 (-) Transcript_36886:145-1170(-)
MEASTAAEQLRGTCLVVGAAMVFAVVALVVKVDPLPLLPATECRFFVSWVIALAFMLWFRESRGLRWFGPPELRGMLLAKSAVSFCFITVWWAAIRRAPVGDCIAIIYTAPILTSLYSLTMLGERLPREFPVQVLLVLAGMLLVLDPPFLGGAGEGAAAEGAAGEGEAAEKPSYTLLIAALLLCAFTPIVTRQTRSCSWIEVEHVGAVTACGLMDPALLLGEFAWSGRLPALPPGAPREALLILLAATGAFVGIAMETKGYQLAEPGKAAMFAYAEVPFGYLLQSLGTSAPVQARALGGAALIIASCGLGAFCQHRRAAELAKDEAASPLLAAASEKVGGA